MSPDTAPNNKKRGGPSFRRCIVHIGANKTGSTTIQDWLGRNHKALAEQRVRYDTFEDRRLPAFIHAIGFTALGLTLSDLPIPNPDARIRHKIDDMDSQRERVAEFTARAEASIAAGGYKTYVISSEYLPAWLSTPELATAFHDWLSARFDRVRYVYYVRDQLDWIPSAYAQMIKMGGTMDFDEYLEKNGERNFCRTATKWRDAVGRGRLDVRLLERDFLKDGDLVADFADVIGAKVEGLTPPATLNEAMDRDSLEKMRQLNLKASSGGKSWSFKERGRAIDKIMRASSGGKLRLTPEQEVLIARRNEACNGRLHQRFFKDREILFPKSHAVLAKAGAEDQNV